MNDNRSQEATPDQLLKLLDLQIEAQRSKRRRTSRYRGLVLTGGVLLIIAGALVAFLILQQMLLDMPRGGQRDESAATVSTAH